MTQLDLFSPEHLALIESMAIEKLPRETETITKQQLFEIIHISRQLCTQDDKEYKLETKDRVATVKVATSDYGLSTAVTADKPPITNCVICNHPLSYFQQTFDIVVCDGACHRIYMENSIQSFIKDRVVL